MQMDVNELYRNLREEGRSAGHAQWIIGNYYRTGRNVKRNYDKAEEWFLKAWDHKFPGTASSQAFILKRQWRRFLDAEYSQKPRLHALLAMARLSADEGKGTIALPVHNDAQKEWIDNGIEAMEAAFRTFTNSRFFSISIITELK